ncbi:hypothetical protein ACQP3L_39625, partial [Escherichia coli]
PNVGPFCSFPEVSRRFYSRINLHSGVELGACFWVIMCSEFQAWLSKVPRSKKSVNLHGDMAG